MLRLEDLLEIKNNHLAIELMLKGKFDEEIQKLKALKDEMEALAEKASTVKKAQKLVSDAEEEAAKIKAEVDEYYAKAQVFEEGLKEKVKNFEDRTFNHQQMADEFVAYKNKVEAGFAETQAAIEKRLADVTAREQAAAAKESELADRETSIANREQSLAAKIAAFKKI